MISWDLEGFVLRKRRPTLAGPNRHLTRSLQLRVFREIICHKLAGLFPHQRLPLTDYLSITTISRLPHNLIKGDEWQRGNFLFLFGGVWGYVVLEASATPP